MNLSWTSLLKSITAVAALLAANPAQAQSFTDRSATGAWNTSRWNNSADGPTYTSTYTANNNVIFTASGTYSFAGMGATVNVGNITVNAGANVNFTSAANTFATNGSVRTFDVASGSTLDFSSQAFSTAAGTGFIKNGSGVLALAGGGYNGGFTLNAGVAIARGVDAFGANAANVLTLNGGTIASNTTRSFSTAKHGGGIVIGGNVQFGALATDVALASSSADLTFANNVSLGGGNRTLTVGNNGNQGFSGVISNGSLTFAAAPGAGGRFDITNAANTFSGPITLNGGEVRFTADGSMGNASNSIVIDGGRFATGNGATFTLGASRNVFVGDTAGTGISTPGSGVFTINNVIADISGKIGSWAKQGGGILELGGVSTYTGETLVNNGTLRLAGGGDRLPTSTFVRMGQAGSTNLGTLDLNGQNQTIAGLASTVGTNTSASRNTVTSAAAATLTVALASGTATYGDGTTQNSGVITGAISLVKSGAGIQVLGGSNTYTGNTFVNAGTLSISADANLGDAAGGITLGGGTLEMTSSFTLGSGRTILALADTTSTLAMSSGTVSYGGAFTGSGNLDKAGAGWLVVSNASSSYTGLFTISAGTLEVTGSNAFANATLRQTGGELLLAPVGGGEVTIPDLDGSSGTTTVAESVTAVVGGSGNSSYNGQIRGQGGLKKVGNGRLTLTGANDFAGDAVVESGILELAAGGSITAPARASNGGQLKVNGRAGGTVTIDAGGILSGSGTLGGLATIAGTHASGNSPGLQTAEDGLSYNASAVLAWELSANTDSLGDRGVLFDAINVTGGNLSITNGATIDLIFTSPLQNLTASTVVWNDAFWNEDRSWTIIDFTSNGTSTGTFALGTIGLDMNGDSLASVRPNASFSVNNVGGDIVLSYVAVPEPPAVLLGGLGVAAAGWAVRRRRTWLNA